METHVSDLQQYNVGVRLSKLSKREPFKHLKVWSMFMFNSWSLTKYSFDSRVQTVVAINGSGQDTQSLNISANSSFHINNTFNSLNGDLNVNYNTLKKELGSLQEKLDSVSDPKSMINYLISHGLLMIVSPWSLLFLNDTDCSQMERSRLNSEVTNQQLMAVISKLSSQLSRAKISNNQPQQRKQICGTPTGFRKQVNNTILESSTARSPLSSASTSSSFRRQKAIRWE